MPLRGDPNFWANIKDVPTDSASIPQPAVHDIESRRISAERYFSSVFADVPEVDGVEITRYEIRTHDGSMIEIFHFNPNSTKPATVLSSAILFVHGGGFITGSSLWLKHTIAKQASSTGVQTFAVQYRLAPEHPYPIPQEDCYTALRWIHANTARFSIDPKRVIVMGESAGGGLAVTVSLLANDRGLLPSIAKQVLLYPMLDDRNVNANREIEVFATWTSEDNLTGWTALLGDARGSDKVSPYAAPARAQDVSVLPPTYIDIGTLDIFRDEVLKFATMLSRANVDTELHLYAGVPHAFDLLAPGCEAAQSAFAHRNKAIKAV